MRKRLSKISIAVMIFTVLGTFCLGLTGCIPVKNISIDELQSREGIMLKISSSNEGPIDWYDNDRVTGSSYNIYWDGNIAKVDHHLESGDLVQKKKLDSSDYMKFYKFAESAYLNKTFEHYSENDVLDGSTYSFTYFPDGKSKSVILYAGYCYSNKRLYGIAELAFSYFRKPGNNETGALTKVMCWEDYEESTDCMMSIRVDDYHLHNSLFDNRGTLIVYDIGWDGVMAKKTLYSDSSEENGTAKLSDEDFEALYNFAKKNFEKNTFEKYYEDWSDDGYAWSFYLFPYEAQDIKLYYGPINGNKELKNIASIVVSYFDR